MDDENQNQSPPSPPPDGWEMLCAGILSTEFGRRPSDAVANAVLQLAEEENGPVIRRQRVRDWWQSLNPMPRLVFSAASAVAVIFLGVGLWLVAAGSAPEKFCSLTGVVDARWTAGSPPLKAGDTMAGGTWRLESGLAELTFGSHARVAIEGPAQITILGSNAMELAYGKLSTEVPQPAHGFAVKTPATTIIDLGTRYGLNVDSDRSIRVEVFEGRVRLMTNSATAVPGRLMDLVQNNAVSLDGDGTISRLPVISENAYPRLSVTKVIHPANCGFDGEGKMSLGGVPATFGYWSGPAFEMTGVTQGIKPVEGIGMLHFLPPPTGNQSEVWQLINLHPYKSMLTNGDLRIGSFAWFNCTRGGVNSARRFGLTVAAYHGEPHNVPELWTHRNELALTVAEKELTADDNPATWEKIDVSAALPPDADFLIVSMRAIAPDDADRAGAFAGDFADLVDCILYEPLRPGAAMPQP